MGYKRGSLSPSIMPFHPHQTQYPLKRIKQSTSHSSIQIRDKLPQSIKPNRSTLNLPDQHHITPHNHSSRMSDALILGYLAPNTTSNNNSKHSKPSSSSVGNVTTPRTASSPSNKRGSTDSGRKSRWSGVPWYYQHLPQKWK